MSLETFVRMTTEERSEHAKTIASHRNRQIALEDEKDEKARHFNSLIKAEQAEIDRVVRLITDDGENRDQMDLFADSRVPDDQAQAALAALQARQPGCSPVDAKTCPIHGTCSCEGDERLEETLLTCILHMPGVPHATIPPVLICSTAGLDGPCTAWDCPQHKSPLPEPRLIEFLANEAVEEWARLGRTPESVKERNARVKEAIAARSIPVHRRKPFGEAVRRLLSDEPSIPAGVSGGPEADGNVAEAGESA